MIPEAKQPAVARALNEAFGVQEFEDICRLTAGLTSAMVFRIVVRRHPYLLRVITRTDDMSDPTRQFACMKSGAERGITPRVLYASIEERIFRFPDGETCSALQSSLSSATAFGFAQKRSSFAKRLGLSSTITPATSPPSSLASSDWLRRPMITPKQSGHRS
jgi:hypothetical protein